MARRGYDDNEADDVAPWLSAAEVEPEARHTHVRKSRLVWWLAVFAILFVVAVGLIYAMVAKPDDGDLAGGDAPLIAAPDGPYKVRPPQAGGMTVEGVGQTAYAAAEGVDPGGDLDLAAAPEEPMARPTASSPAAGPPVGVAAVQPKTPAAAPPALPPAVVAVAKSPPVTPPAAKVVAAEVKPKPVAAAPKPKSDKLADLDASLAAASKPAAKAVAPAPAPGGSGTALQLGAFSTEAKAKAAWKNFSGRYGYLAGLEQAISPLARDGATLYRLRATGAASHAQAADLCARLKIAGEQCSVTE